MASKARINVVLTMYDTEFTEERDWDLWTAHVAEYLPALMEEPVDVDAVAWSRRANPPFRDEIRTGPLVLQAEHEALTELVRHHIQRLWDDGDWWYESTEAKAEKAAEEAEEAARDEAIAAHDRAVDAGGYNGPEDG